MPMSGPNEWSSGYGSWGRCSVRDYWQVLTTISDKLTAAFAPSLIQCNSERLHTAIGGQSPSRVAVNRSCVVSPVAQPFEIRSAKVMAPARPAVESKMRCITVVRTPRSELHPLPSAHDRVSRR